jgi:hypothetical protein
MRSRNERVSALQKASSDREPPLISEMPGGDPAGVTEASPQVGQYSAVPDR